MANNKKKNPEIICIDDDDDESDEISENSYDGSIEELGDEVSEKLNNTIESEENNEEQWKDDDFLLFSTDEKETKEKTTTKNERKSNDSNRNGTHRSRVYQPQKAQDVSLTSVLELPPWMDSTKSIGTSYHTPPLIKLHNEIVDFAALMAPQEDEIQERHKLTERVTDLIVTTFGGAQNCKVQVFGSQATGLFLPTSDIDMVVMMEEQKQPPPPPQKSGKYSEKDKETLEMQNWSVFDGTSPLVRLGDALSSKWKDEISFLEVILQTRIPIVKFTHEPTNLSIDICFNQHTGVQAADLMKKFMEAMPPLKPLTFVLKYYMVSRDLNEPYSGGIGSFMLQMMIVSFLQHREREEYSCCRNTGKYTNLGSLLLEFFELYGVDFNYVTTGISVRNDGFYFPKGAKDKKKVFWQPFRPSSLALENPFESSADVGRASFRMSFIQRSFDASFRILLTHLADPVVPTLSILATILPPTKEMKKRATLLKVLNIEHAGFEVETDDKNKRRNKQRQHHNRTQRDTNHYSDTSSSSDDGSYDNFQPNKKSRRRN